MFFGDKSASMKIAELSKVGLQRIEVGQSQSKLGHHLGVSKNSGTPKWMVIMENPIKIDDLGVPLFLETSI